jgi:hypothetical protein
VETLSRKAARKMMMIPPIFDSSEEASYEDEASSEVHGIRNRSRFGKDAIP